MDLIYTIYFVVVLSPNLFHSNFQWEITICIIMRNDIILVVNRHPPFGWLQARFTDISISRILLSVRIINC